MCGPAQAWVASAEATVPSSTLPGLVTDSQTLVDGWLPAAASLSSDEAAPSVISPTLECFQIEKDTVLPWANGGLGSASIPVGNLCKPTPEV